MITSSPMSRTYVYVLESQKDGWLYVGRTRDLMGRFYLHSADLMAPTKYRGPFRLAYFRACQTPKMAERETGRLRRNGLTRDTLEAFQRQRNLL